MPPVDNVAFTVSRQTPPDLLNNIAFKVSRQAPSVTAPLNGVINCRISKSKKPRKTATSPEPEGTPPARLISTSVASLKRNYSLEPDDDLEAEGSRKSSKGSPDSSPRSVTPTTRSVPINRIRLTTPRKIPGPTKLRIDQPVKADISGDIWFNILSFTHPEQLLRLRTSVSLFSRYILIYTKLWEQTRTATYGDELPPPIEGITEFQYADLRHGHGCQNCRAHKTRKTYWVFLRRWCKNCLNQLTVDDKQAIDVLKNALGGEDAQILNLRSCIPSATVDSWGNFVGAGAATYPHHKSAFLRADIERIIDEYQNRILPSSPDWQQNLQDFNRKKYEYVQKRHVFAKQLEAWEDTARLARKATNQSNKDARRAFFTAKAARLTPPMTKEVLERCPSYKRSIDIAKPPHMTAWVQLKPKIEAEREKAEQDNQKEKEKIAQAVAATNIS